MTAKRIGVRFAIVIVFPLVQNRLGLLATSSRPYH
jgi:hypothetical protein